MQLLRIIFDEEVDHAHGLATDDALAKLANKQEFPTLRLYTFKPCALVGRFQRIENEVNAEYCQTFEIPVNRRPSGGGAVIMGPEQLGIALTFGTNHRSFFVESASLIKNCARGIVSSLQELGIQAQFHGKNDLVVNGKKIAGLGSYQSQSGGVLFHASLLLDLDLDYMLKVLRTPFEKTVDKGFKSISERMTTVRAQLKHSMDLHDLQRYVQRGFSREFGVAGEVETLNEKERMLASELCEQQYSQTSWTYPNATKVRDQIGKSRVKTAGGTLEVRAIVAGQTLKSVFFNGDFIASHNAVLELESSLRWHPRDVDAICQTIERAVAKYDRAWHQISADELSAAVARAVAQTQQADPYACFASF